MGITWQNHIFANSTGNLPSLTPLAGDLLIVTVISSSGPTISGGGLTWNQIASVSLGSGPTTPFLTMWYAENVPATSMTVTVSASTVGFTTLDEFSGLATNLSLDTSGNEPTLSTSGSSTLSLTAANITPVVDGDLIFAAVNVFNTTFGPRTASAPSGFSATGTFGGSGLACAFLVQNPAANITVNFTDNPTTGTEKWSGIAAAFKAAGSRVIGAGMMMMGLG